MSRPKKGTEAGEKATAKWRDSMLKKYGGVEKLHEALREHGRIGGSRGRGPEYTGGFAAIKVGADGLTGRQRARISGAKGGKISRRTKKDPIEEAERILEEESGRTHRDA